MGLFDDTIRDAHRPLASGWVRRAASQQAEPPAFADELPEETPEELAAESGMQTVFRFQKAGSPLGGPREAPSRPGAAKARPAAGDPLTAGAEVESPEPPARNEGLTDISVEGDRRVGNLETGQAEGGRPVEVAAAKADSESFVHQSEVTSESVEAESYRVTHQSETAKGSSPSASLSVEAFPSRSAGRGAPSESYEVVQENGLDAPAPSVTGAQPQRPPGAGVAGRREGGRPSRVAGADRTETLSAPPPLPVSPPAFGRQGAAPARRDSAGTEPSGLVIGRIDVVVTAPDSRDSRPRPASSDGRGFLSRNYLKRL